MDKKEIVLGLGAAVIIGLLIVGANVMPLLLIAAVALIMYRLPAVRQALGKNSLSPSVRPASLTFADIGGQEMAKQELIEALEFVCQRDDALTLGIRPLRGILLSGPPGTGKTLLARAAAGYTGSAFMSTSGSEFVEMYAGVGAQRIRDLFNRARQAARKTEGNSCIIFVDEIEVLAGRRGRHSSHLEYDQTLNQLLVEMDGIATADEEQILVIAATNRSDLLDPALLRPGRFDRIVNVGLPDREARRAILQLHMRKKPVCSSVDIDAIARETFGFSGAHLESVTNEAAILAMREKKSVINHNHLMEAVDKVAMGERLDKRPSDAEMERIAVHEIGHAIISEIHKPGSVSSVTVASRGNALGYVRQAMKDDNHLHTGSDLKAEISILVAGSAAEQLVFDGHSTGSASDLSRAVELARQIVSSGLSDLGVVDVDALPSAIMHKTVQKIISDCLQSTHQHLAENRQSLDQLVSLLSESEKITGEQLRTYLEPQHNDKAGITH